MSEYQYYEFQAIDRPLDHAAQQALRKISSRARITSTSFTNHYEWGDLKGDPRTFMDNAERANRIVHDLVARYGGSFSAEHGVGQLKRDDLVRYKSPVEVAVMRTIKAALDPAGIMNPGKVL